MSAPGFQFGSFVADRDSRGGLFMSVQVGSRYEAEAFVVGFRRVVVSFLFSVMAPQVGPQVAGQVKVVFFLSCPVFRIGRFACFVQVAQDGVSRVACVGDQGAFPEPEKYGASGHVRARQTGTGR